MNTVCLLSGPMFIRLISRSFAGRVHPFLCRHPLYAHTIYLTWPRGPATSSLLHVVPGGHTLPQPPQLFLSVSETQVPLQQFCLPPQSAYVCQVAARDVFFAFLNHASAMPVKPTPNFFSACHRVTDRANPLTSSSNFAFILFILFRFYFLQSRADLHGLSSFSAKSTTHRNA